MTTEAVTTDSIPEVSANSDRNYGFVLGLIVGSVVGAGLGMLFAPRAVLELRKRAADSAKSLGHAASDRYHETSTRIGAAVHEMNRKGQGLRDNVADAVVRGAHGVERYAANAKTGH